MKKLLLAVALAPFALGFSMANAQTEVTTDPVGFVKTNLTNSGYTPVGLNLVKPAVHSALVSAATASTVALSGEGAVGALEQGVSYYLEIVDGALEGDRVDINTAATIAAGDGALHLDTAAAHNTLSDASAIPAGSRIVIRPHNTFSDITAVLGSALHTGANFPDSSDQIITWEGSGFAASAVFDGAWFDAAGNPVDDKIIAPGSGFLFYANPDAPARELDLLVLGEVRSNDFVRPLTAGYNMVSIGAPVDASPADLGITTAQFTGGDDPSQADQILTWSGSGFAENWLFSDGTWYDAAGNPVSDQNLFQADGAVLVYLNAPSGDPDFRVPNQVQ